MQELPADDPTINRQAQDLLAPVLDAAPHAPEFDDGLEAMLSLGGIDMLEAARLCRSVIKQPLPTPSANRIETLRSLLAANHPKHFGQLDNQRRLFGFIPLGSSWKPYLQHLQRSSNDILAQLERLGQVQDALERYQAALSDYQAGLERVSRNLATNCAVLRQIKRDLLREIHALVQSDHSRAKALEQELLHALDTHLAKMQVQHSICAQGRHTVKTMQECGHLIARANGDLRQATLDVLSLAQGVAQACQQPFEFLSLTKGNLKALAEETLKTREGEINEKNAEQRLHAGFDSVFSALSEMRKANETADAKLAASKRQASQQPATKMEKKAVRQA